MRVNNTRVCAVLNEFHRRHEIRVGADEDRVIEQSVDRRLNQVRSKRCIYAFLDAALEWTSTMRALAQGSSTVWVLAGVWCTRLSLFDGDTIAWEAVHRVEETTEAGICRVAGID